jgi:hypothetical protein
MKTRRALLQFCRLIVMVLALPSPAQAQFTVTTNNGTITINGYTGAGGNVTIPGTINGYPVVSIQVQAFQEDNFTGIAIPDSVTNIGQSAFYDCASLTNVTIGTNMSTIGPYAFSYCTSLIKINVAAKNPFYSSVNGVLFNKDQTTLVEYPGGLSGGYDIPASVTSVGVGAFWECASLSNLTMTASVTNIGMQAFFYCTGLTNVSSLGSVISIGYEAFDACATLASIAIPGSATNIGDYAFYDCYALTNAIIRGNGNQLGVYAFAFCPVLTNLTISNGVASIGNDAFAYCTGLPKVTIADSVTNIGMNAFAHCTALTNVTLPACAVGFQPFASCPHLVRATITGAGSVGAYAFNGSSSLTNLTISNGVTGIGTNAFSGCGMTSLTIPGSVANIAYEGFGGCENLANLVISNGVASIGDYAFEYSSLTGVTLPASVTTIGVAPFYECANLTAITVAAQNSYYGSFGGVLFDKTQSTLVECPTGLSGDFAIPSSVTRIENFAFDDCGGLTHVTFPNGVTNIGSYAFFSCASLTNEIIPAGVASIGDYAFDGCSGLLGAFFKGKPPALGTNVFLFDSSTTIYYLPGATGWGSSFASLPAVLWNPLIQTADGHFGVLNNQFGFNITSTTNIPIVLEACVNLTDPVWTPLAALTLTNGSFHFNEPLQASPAGRYYRIRSP